jgi:STE24 endopeptidase
MQLILLGLIVALFLHDTQSLAGATAPAWSWHDSLTSVVAKLAVAGLYALLCRRTVRQMHKPGAIAALRLADRGAVVYRQAVLALYVWDLWAGLLTAVRHAIGDLILIDELVVLLPPMAMLVWAWYVHYPIERRLREATLIRQLDSGLPVHPVWTRSEYLLFQVRHHMALTLVPLLVLVAWMETVNLLGPPYWSVIDADPRPILSLSGSVLIFLLAPLLIRHVWDTVALPDGDLRRRLVAMCRQYHVGVRDLLLWRTYGGMINGAVMGLIAPLRYILLTDALLERVPTELVEAVMAHELAHVRKHHMFWLAATAFCSLTVLTFAWTVAGKAVQTQFPPVSVVYAAPSSEIPLEQTPPPIHPIGETGVVDWVIALAAIGSWVAVFGWVSRRFERQADVFAVQHLSRQYGGQDAPAHPPLVLGVAVGIMSSALQLVADLNHISPTRRSWRHGSIAWRQAYLHTLRGRPLDALPIDRQVRWIKIATAAALIGLAVLDYWFSPWLDSLPI